MAAVILCSKKQRRRAHQEEVLCGLRGSANQKPQTIGLEWWFGHCRKLLLPKHSEVQQLRMSLFEQVQMIETHTRLDSIAYLELLIPGETFLPYKPESKVNV